ncbi:MAG: extracellular solute-binding protein [Pseudomonadota bacterium]
MFAIMVRTCLIALALLLGTSATRAENAPSHGLSAFGELKYPADFQHFAYVRPDAPKGGRIAVIGTRGLITFDSFNGYILRGDAAQGLSLLFEGFSLVFDSLMTRAWDEPDAVYGLVAKGATVAEDRRSVTFALRPEARFADGSQLTADDVKFSFDILKSKGHPNYRTILRDVVSAEVLNPTTIKYSFKGNQLRDLPLYVAALPIFSKAYYATREFDQTTLDPPLGSGPYRIADHQQGSFVSYRRRDDYWAKDLPVNRGRWNFDEVRFEYYRDRTAELQALKAGVYDLREEFTSRDWATAYNVPAVRDGVLKRLILPDQRPSGTQGFFINTRKKKFADLRVRRALDYAFNFEWTNKNIFYSLYKRTTGYFQNSPLAASGPPTPSELKLLEPFRAKLPISVFSDVYVPPVSNGEQRDRSLLRQAVRLLNLAGWRTVNGVRQNANGDKLDVEFLIFSPSFERIIQPYVETLKAIGIDASIRRVDPAQFERRMKTFDFDITTQRFVMSSTPGAGLRAYFGSQAAKTDGSFNLAGISDPVVDDLISKVIEAKTRQDMTDAARALDRVLRAGHYWVSHWYKGEYNVAHWDRFGRPEIQPSFQRGILHTWWYDPERSRAVDAWRKR